MSFKVRLVKIGETSPLVRVLTPSRFAKLKAAGSTLGRAKIFKVVLKSFKSIYLACPQRERESKARRENKIAFLEGQGLTSPQEKLVERNEGDFFLTKSGILLLEFQYEGEWDWCAYSPSGALLKWREEFSEDVSLCKANVSNPRYIPGSEDEPGEWYHG